MSYKEGHEEKKRDAAVMLQGFAAGMASGPVVDVAEQPAARPLASPAARSTAKHPAAQQPVDVAKHVLCHRRKEMKRRRGMLQ